MLYIFVVMRLILQIVNHIFTVKYVRFNRTLNIYIYTFNELIDSFKVFHGIFFGFLYLVTPYCRSDDSLLFVEVCFWNIEQMEFQSDPFQILRTFESVNEIPTHDFRYVRKRIVRTVNVAGRSSFTQHFLIAFGTANVFAVVFPNKVYDKYTEIRFDDSI